ncbi:MAG: hypothetical protein KA184_05310 [Candidatus Hydrogenedentes bacterium]|nr:hypothetical protein [Candidatus Hydrogenedentota bacterium]
MTNRGLDASKALLELILGIQALFALVVGLLFTLMLFFGEPVEEQTGEQ